MDDLQSLLNTISGIVWGPVMMVLLLGTGLFITLGLKFYTIRKIPAGFKNAVTGVAADKDAAGEITPFQALATALSATVGTGNLAGVATAIFLGGPGAIFWMWMTALVGMATKYSEAVLAVKYREIDAEGRYVAGPMYYIKNGLGKGWGWLGGAFAVFAIGASFGAGNMVQANSVADAMEANFGVPPLWSGLGLATLAFAVIIGGVRRIAVVAEFMVPGMAVLYVGGALTVLAFNAEHIPGAFGLIFSSAFTGTAATGGFAGAAVWAVLRFGIARGIFSNEAGLGSAAIAHGVARTKGPVHQGTIAIAEVFIDTILICTVTALVILTVQVPVEMADGTTQMMGAWASGQTGAQLSTYAFGQGLPGAQWVVTIGLLIFAFTTVLGWSYYGERAAEYLFGLWIITPYRLFFVAMIVVGAVAKLSIVWTAADILNALMAIPNLIALILLSGTVFAITRQAIQKGEG